MVYEYNVQYVGSRSHPFSEIDLHTNHPCEKISRCPSKTQKWIRSRIQLLWRPNSFTQKLNLIIMVLNTIWLGILTGVNMKTFHIIRLIISHDIILLHGVSAGECGRGLSTKPR